MYTTYPIARTPKAKMIPPTKLGKSKDLSGFGGAAVVGGKVVVVGTGVGFTVDVEGAVDVVGWVVVELGVGVVVVGGGLGFGVAVVVVVVVVVVGVWLVVEFGGAGVVTLFVLPATFPMESLETETAETPKEMKIEKMKNVKIFFISILRDVVVVQKDDSRLFFSLQMNQNIPLVGDHHRMNLTNASIELVTKITEK